MNFSDQRRAEIEQGQKVAARNARVDELYRLENTGVIEIRHTGATRSAPASVQVWTRRRILRSEEPQMLIEAPYGDWPTEVQMAQVALGLQAFGWEIPPRPEPSADKKRMMDYRTQHVKNWSNGI